MSNSIAVDPHVKEALDLLDHHFDAFGAAAPLAKKTGHPVPIDTRGWSQILVSILFGVKGLARKKGADLDDGSDVKGANTWEAIDTPRFNGVLKAGTHAHVSGKIESLDGMPYLFFVLWDHEPTTGNARCRIWAVRAQKDSVFRKMCAQWYEQHAAGTIVSNNFQLHPPRGKNSNVIRNTCGN
ncbi:MAG: MamI family restriction endonuclease, partial [Actinomycetota bacterium]